MRCRLCNSLPIQRIDDGNKLYYHCQRCDYIFLDTQFILSAAEEKSRYENHRNDTDNRGYIQMFEDLFAKIFVHTKAVKMILDFGCGPGPVMAKLLSQKGYSISLYDRFFYKEDQNLEKEYDMIISTEVFEHLQQPQIILEQLASIVKKGGYIALMTRFHPKDPQSFKKWYYKIDDTHIGFFSKQTFIYLAHSLNLTMIYSDDKKIVLFQK